MPSKLQMNNVELSGDVTMGYSTEGKKSSMHPAFRSEKEKVLSPRSRRSLKLRDKGKTLKSEKLIEQPCSDDHTAAVQKNDDKHSFHSFPPSTSGSYQKQCPSKVNTGDEELVKHMSKVPGYLQRVERGNNVEKALNFGVLDWGRLEKWTYSQESAVNGGNVYSPSSSDASSFSMSGSSSQSFRSSGSSSLSQKNQSRYLNFRRNPSTKDDVSQVLQDKSSRQNVNFDNSENAAQNISFGHHQLLKIDHKLVDSKGTDSDIKTVTSDSYQPSSFGRLQSTSKEYYTSATVMEKKKTRNCTSMCQAEKVQVSGNDQQYFSGSSLFNRNLQQEHSSRFLRNIDGARIHLQERRNGSDHFSYESQESDDARQIELNSRSILGLFPSEKVQSASQSPVRHSCSFPSSIGANEWSDVQGCVSGSGQCKEIQSDAINNPLYSDEIATTRFIDNLEQQNMFTASHPSLITVKTPDRLDQDEVKIAAKTGRNSISNYQPGISLRGLTRSSSLKESSAIQQVILTAHPNSSNVDKSTSSSRTRRSPLRRMLDPLLKPKALKHVHFPETITGSSRQRVCEFSHTEKTSGTCNSQHVSSNTSTGQSGWRFSSPSPVPTKVHGSLQDEKQDASSKQALLQLVWKNGLPLFTFSVNDSEILAATKKISISSKEDLEGIYTFYSIQETKKRGGGWISQDSKSKRKGLASNVVGQMNVSCSQCPNLAGPDLKDHFTSREFVLFGAESRSEVHDCLSSSELAAIIVRIPKENTKSLDCDMLQVDMTRDLSHVKQMDGFHCCQVGKLESGPNKERSTASVVAILPSEAHGLSDIGRPSTLIERWKSGGTCDCGGWDVGCTLRVLTNNFEESKSSRGIQSLTTDGTHRAELYIQGGAQGNKCVFSLVAFKEGLYTVDFHKSIGVLQVFSVCVAILHSRNSTKDIPEEQNSAQCGSLGASAKGLPRRNGEAPTGIDQCHPPLSPVGRA